MKIFVFLLALVTGTSGCIGPMSKEARDYRAYEKGYWEMNQFITDNQGAKNLGFRNPSESQAGNPRARGAAACLWYYLRDNPYARAIWDEDIAFLKKWKEELNRPKDSK